MITTIIILLHYTQSFKSILYTIHQTRIKSSLGIILLLFYIMILRKRKTMYSVRNH